MSDPAPRDAAAAPRASALSADSSRRRSPPSAMLRRFGLLVRLSLVGVVLGRLRLEDHSAENIRRANAKGPLVYALHTWSLLDWLALNRTLNRRKLPLAVVTPGLRSTWFRPMGAALKEVFETARDRLRHGAAPDPVASGWLADAVARGRTACIWLTRHRPIRDALAGEAPDPVAALLQAQERSERPVQVVPVVVIWRREPEAKRGEVARFLLGNQDEPGPIGKLWSVLTRSGLGIVQAGEALDLTELRRRLDPEASPARQARTARILLRRYLYRESQVVRGPRIRPHRQLRGMVLRSPELRTLVEQEAAATGRSKAALRKEVARTFDRIAARMSAGFMQFGDLAGRVLFSRIYDGVDIRDEDLERVRAALRAGTPILVPNHRSHLDYLLISCVFYQNDVAPPHIVAGDNLGFFPLGALLRRMGAFFIKRSFAGDRVFPVVFERYLRQLIRDGFPVEFFLEGGRSRTGKMLPPKLGVLGMVLDAAASTRPDRDVTFLPISISYEQVAEESAYQRELTGAPKEREDLGQVVRATKVLGRRYGRVYLRVGEPMLAREILDEADGPWKEQDREHRREILQRAGERISYRIASSTVTLPTSVVAMALLAQSGRGVRVSELHGRVARLLELLERSGAVVSRSLRHVSWAVDQAMERFERTKLVSRLADEEGDILQVAFEQRMTLEHYKNALLHFVTPASLMAAAVRGLERAEQPLDRERLRRLFRLQVFLLRYEVTLDPEVPLDDLGDRALDDLVAYGALLRGDDGVMQPGPRRLTGELAGLTRNLLESYLLVLQAAQALRSRDIPGKELPIRIQEWGRVRLAIDEIERHEALSLVNLQNAVRAFREEGVIEVRAGGGGLQFNDDAMRHYTRTLRLLLLRREP